MQLETFWTAATLPVVATLAAVVEAIVYAGRTVLEDFARSRAEA